MNACPVWCTTDHSADEDVPTHETTLIEATMGGGRLMIVMDSDSEDRKGRPDVRMTVDIMMGEMTADQAKELARAIWASAHVMERASAITARRH